MMVDVLRLSDALTFLPEGKLPKVSLVPGTLPAVLTDGILVPAA